MPPVIVAIRSHCLFIAPSFCVFVPSHAPPIAGRRVADRLAAACWPHRTGRRPCDAGGDDAFDPASMTVARCALWQLVCQRAATSVVDDIACISMTWEITLEWASGECVGLMTQSRRSVTLTHCEATQTRASGGDAGEALRMSETAECWRHSLRVWSRICEAE